MEWILSLDLESDVSIIDEVVGTRLKLLHPIMVVMKLRITDLLSI